MHLLAEYFFQNFYWGTKTQNNIPLDNKLTAALHFVGYMYNYGHAIYDMSELAQYPFIAIWNSRSNVGQGHFMLELMQGSNCV